MRKKLLRTIQVGVVSMLTVAATAITPAQAFAQDGCSYTPQTATLGGKTIFGGARWDCDLPRSIYREYRVQIRMEGRKIKETVFKGYGPIKSTLTAGVACVPGFHWYSVRTYGFDGLGPTVYVPKESREIPWSC